MSPVNIKRFGFWASKKMGTIIAAPNQPADKLTKSSERMVAQIRFSLIQKFYHPPPIFDQKKLPLPGGGSKGCEQVFLIPISLSQND